LASDYVCVSEHMIIDIRSRRISDWSHTLYIQFPESTFRSRCLRAKMEASTNPTYQHSHMMNTH